MSAQRLKTAIVEVQTPGQAKKYFLGIDLLSAGFPDDQPQDKIQ